MPKNRVKVILRHGECPCGCKGRSPGHQKSVQRVVTQEDDQYGTCSLPGKLFVPVYREKLYHCKTFKCWVYGDWEVLP